MSGSASPSAPPSNDSKDSNNDDDVDADNNTTSRFNDQSDNDNNWHYYSILNVPYDADFESIQRNYKLLSKVYHPDKTTAMQQSSSSSIVQQQQQQGTTSSAGPTNNSLLVAQESFIVIKTAVDVLLDPIYRWAYDQYGDIAIIVIKRSQQHLSSRRRTKRQKRKGSNSNARRNTESATTRQADYDDDDENKDNDDDNVHDESDTSRDDLYTLLEDAISDNNNNYYYNANSEQALSILQQAIEEYHRVQQKQQGHNGDMVSPKINISCDVPLTYRERDRYNHSTNLHSDSISINVHSRSPIHSAMGISYGVGSTVQRTAETNIVSNIGIDYQPVLGTNINTTITSSSSSNRFFRPDTISINTSRKCYNETIIVAGIQGNVKSSKSWYTSLITYKPILLESIIGKSSSSSWFGWYSNAATVTTLPTKLMAQYRIVCDIYGRLRGCVMSLRTIEYPIWTVRVSLSFPYPIKISYQNADPNKNESDDNDNNNNNNNNSTYYIAVSLGIFTVPRVKIVRITNIGTESYPCTIKYGFKYDTQAILTKKDGGSIWSIILHVQFHDQCTLRIPIRLGAVMPIAWMISTMIAGWIEDQIQRIKVNMLQTATNVKNDNNAVDTEDRVLHDKTRIGAIRQHLSPQSITVFRNIAMKKRQDEANKVEGLIITRAVLTIDQSNEYDITDTLQFWVTQSKLQFEWNDPRLLWQIHSHQQQSNRDNGGNGEETTTLYSWWKSIGNFVSSTNRSRDEATKASIMKTTLDVRYQYKGMTYQILFTKQDNLDTKKDQSYDCKKIQLPNMNATELGPSDRVR